MAADCPHNVTRTRKSRDGDREIRHVTCFKCGEDLGTFVAAPGQATPASTTLDTFRGE